MAVSDGGRHSILRWRSPARTCCTTIIRSSAHQRRSEPSSSAASACRRPSGTDAAFPRFAPAVRRRGVDVRPGRGARVPRQSGVLVQFHEVHRLAGHGNGRPEFFLYLRRRAESVWPDAVGDAGRRDGRRPSPGLARRERESSLLLPDPLRTARRGCGTLPPGDRRRAGADGRRIARLPGAGRRHQLRARRRPRALRDQPGGGGTVAAQGQLAPAPARPRERLEGRVMRRWFRDLPIRRKLALMTLASSVIALVFAGVGVFTWDVVQYRREITRDLSAQARTIAENSTASITFEDPRSAGETLAVLEIHPNVEYACMFRADGSLFATYFRDGGGGGCPPVSGDELEVAWGEARIVAPVDFGGRRIGTLLIMRDLRDVIERLSIGGGILAALLV